MILVSMYHILFIYKFIVHTSWIKNISICAHLSWGMSEPIVIKFGKLFCDLLFTKICFMLFWIMFKDLVTFTGFHTPHIEYTTHR